MYILYNINYTCIYIMVEQVFVSVVFTWMILESKELSKCPIYLIFLFGNLNFGLYHFIAMGSSVLTIVYAISVLFLETRLTSIEQSFLY